MLRETDNISKSKKKKILIQGSPKCRTGIPCSFWQECIDGYELHFCTATQKQGSTVHSWYRWYLGNDFFETLNKYSRLPLEIDIDELMETMKLKDDLQEQLNDQKKQLAQKDEQLAQKDEQLAQKDEEMEESKRQHKESKKELGKKIGQLMKQLKNRDD